MSKNLLNETFQKHLGLLHKKLKLNEADQGELPLSGERTSYDDTPEIKDKFWGDFQTMSVKTFVDQYGKMLLGTNIQAAYTTVSDMGIDVFGLNCSTGPSEMTPSVRWLDEQNEHNILVVPNAGMPENQGGRAVYKMTPEKMGEALGDFLKQYKKVRIIGGCCGTNPEHIKALRKVIDERANSVEG